MSICFEMTDGTIVEAKKDCNCVTHEGPHWLHMDEMVREVLTAYENPTKSKEIG